MSTAAAPRVTGKSFRLALCQMGGVTSNVSENLSRAKELIAVAARGDSKQRVDLVVLPVRLALFPSQSVSRVSGQFVSNVGKSRRKSSTRPTPPPTFPSTPRRSLSVAIRRTTSKRANLRVSKCYLSPQRKPTSGSSEVSFSCYQHGHRRNYERETNGLKFRLDSGTSWRQDLQHFSHLLPRRTTRSDPPQSTPF